MTLLLIWLGGVALVLPGLGATAALRGNPRTFVTLDMAAVIFGLVSVATGLCTSLVIGVLHLVAGAPLVQFEGHVSPGGIAASVASLAALGLMASQLSGAAVRARRGRRSAHVDSWLGEHHDLGDHEVVVVPTSSPLAYSVEGSPPQVVISEGLRDSIGDDLVALVIDHERAHLRARHGRALLVAALADGAFGWSTGVLRSTTALRLAVERAADETAAGGDPRRRHRLGAAMCAVGDSLRLPYGRAEQVRHRARLLVLPPDASTAVFPLVAAAGLIALAAVAAGLVGHVAGGDLPALVAVLS